MSATNHTSHYNLSQYVGSDKPTYLVDYNSDMSAIDTGIYEAKNEADSNATNIGTLSNLTTTEKTNLVGAINEIDGDVGDLSTTVENHTTAIASNTTNIGTMANLNTTDKSSLVGAVNEVNYKTTQIEKFNLVNFKQYDVGTTVDITKSNAAFNYSGTITIATNSDGSIFKIYGTIGYTNTSSSVQSGTITLNNTGIDPDSAFTIDTAGFKSVIPGGTNVTDCYQCNLTINANGSISISDEMVGNQSRRQFLFPCLYFAKDFGDNPEE